MFSIIVPILLIAVAAIGYASLENSKKPDTGANDTAPPLTQEENDSAVPGIPDVPGEKRVSFLAVGDNLIHERVFTYADQNAGELNDGNYDFKPSYKHVKDIIQKADLAFVNQETIIGGDHLGISGYPAFNSPKQLASDLVETGFNMINGASNHTLDKLFEGIQHSASVWREFEDVIFVGAYDTQEDADTIRVIEREGIKFSLLAYTYGTNGYKLPNSYSVPLFDKDKITRDVERAKEISDVVMVSAHWGNENTYVVSEEQVAYAQLFADLGVDLVIGTHPHVIQSLEWVEGKNGNKTLVAYSLGNFLSTMELVDTQLEGMLSLDFVRNEEDDTVLMENIVWTPLVNHFGDGTFRVMPLKEYTAELNAVHFVLGEQKPDAIQYFKTKTKEIIGDKFDIDM